MTWTVTESLDAFLAEAGEFLHRHPAHNTVLLTVLDRLAKDGVHAFSEQAPRFGWYGSPVAGVFLQTPPYAVRLGLLSEEKAGVELARVLHARGIGPGGVGGWRASCEAFAKTWEELTGTTATVHVEQRLYRLAELRRPSPAPSGRARPAGTADLELLMEWCEAFMTEVNERQLFDYRAWVERRTADRDLLIWEDGGRPVAFAGCSPAIDDMSRIGPVYTPPEARGHGYASGLVAEVSEYARARGAQQVLLFTDLANPTANSIYQKLGYRPVDDSAVFEFTG